MEPAEVKVGDLYTYKGENYIVRALIKIKDKGDSNWYDGVLYTPANGDFLYARWLTDFNSKFQPATH